VIAIAAMSWRESVAAICEVNALSGGQLRLIRSQTVAVVHGLGMPVF